MDKLLIVAIIMVGIWGLWGLPILTLINADQTPPEDQQVLVATQPIKTISRFTTQKEELTEVIPRQVIFKDDPEKEAGIEEVLIEGEDGQKITTTKISFYDGEEYSREISDIKLTPPKDKIVSRGTKIIWHTLDIADGQITYWKKMRVYATHYDSKCPGCNDWTAIGLRAGKGVIAVDPAVIKLRSQVYIPGYGHAVAGDTGGSIRGNIIDLGFDDAKTAGWHAQYIDIYLL